jgi:hypothetical protein
MSPKEKRELLALMREVAWCADRAADHVGRDRDLASLRQVIASQEREHRALGRRMVGNIGARMTIAQSVDLFVCRTLAEGILTHASGSAPISDLVGLREDYVRGAILAADPRFRTDFLARVSKRYPGRVTEILQAVAGADYADLVKASS